MPCTVECCDIDDDFLDFGYWFNKFDKCNLEWSCVWSHLVFIGVNNVMQPITYVVDATDEQPISIQVYK